MAGAFSLFAASAVSLVVLLVHSFGFVRRMVCVEADTSVGSGLSSLNGARHYTQWASNIVVKPCFRSCCVYIFCLLASRKFLFSHFAVDHL